MALQKRNRDVVFQGWRYEIRCTEHVTPPGILEALRIRFGLVALPPVAGSAKTDEAKKQQDHYYLAECQNRVLCLGTKLLDGKDLKDMFDFLKSDLTVTDNQNIINTKFLFDELPKHLREDLRILVARSTSQKDTKLKIFKSNLRNNQIGYIVTYKTPDKKRYESFYKGDGTALCKRAFLEDCGIHNYPTANEQTIFIHGNKDARTFRTTPEPDQLALGD